MKQDTHSFASIMLLGAGELGRELTISLKRLGKTVIAVDSYQNAPAMQMADYFEVINMLDGEQLADIIKRHQPDLVVPEIEAIRTEKLMELEKDGQQIVPNATAVFLTMNRVAIRELAAQKLLLKTARYAYAESEKKLRQAILEEVQFPCVVKPIMSSSGKGQSTINDASDISKAWEYACLGMRGDQKKVIVEEFVKFNSEITLLTIRTHDGQTHFIKPIGHRQEKGDYRESWLPATLSPNLLAKAQEMAKKITTELGGAGLFGVEFFITDDDVIFSELSPRPHDTGMTTLIGQNLNEFDLHARAILGLPIPNILYTAKTSASAVILGEKTSEQFSIEGLEQALATDTVDIRLFSKPTCRPGRRMGVALATGENISEAISKAKKAAASIMIQTD